MLVKGYHRHLTLYTLFFFFFPHQEISVSHSFVSDSSPSCGLTLWTVACHSPLSMGFPRQEHWRGLPFPSTGYLPHPGIKSVSPALQADSLQSEPKQYSNSKPVLVMRK